MTSSEDRDQAATADANFLAERFRLPGYSIALQQVIYTGSATLAYGQMPLGSPPPLSYAEGAQSEEGREQIISGKEVDTWEKKTHELVIPDADCLSGQYGTIFDQLSEQCVALAADLEQMRLRALGESCRAAGQEAPYDKNANQLDIFLSALEMTRTQFDSEGNPRFDECYMVRQEGSNIRYIPYAFLIKCLEELGTAEQKAKFEEIIQREKDDREAGRRAF